MASIFGWPGSGNVDSALDIAVYDRAGTYSWSKPTGCVYVIIWVVGAGGGGGSGRKGLAGTTRNGGNPGATGGTNWMEVEASVLSAQCQVVVGAGGAGGIAIVGNSTNGGTGSQGGTSTFGLGSNSYSTSATLLTSTGGSGGPGGTSAARSTPDGGSSFGNMYSPGTFLNNSGKFGDTSGFGTDLSTLDEISYTNRYPSGSSVNIAVHTPLRFFKTAVTYCASGGPVGTDGCNGMHGVGGGGGGCGTDNVINSGAGGRGGDGLVVVMSFGGSIPCDFQGFTSNGQWVKPRNQNFTTARVTCIAGGGGGGSGRRGALNTARYGGAGGGSGCITVTTWPLAYLPDIVDVQVGLGGAGGSDPGANDTNGLPGGDGGDSLFGTFIGAIGGKGGPGGSTTSPTGGPGGQGGVFNGTSGGNPFPNQTSRTSISGGLITCGGGAGGGKALNNDAGGAGSDGLVQQPYNVDSTFATGLSTSRTFFTRDDFFGLVAASPARGGNTDSYQGISPAGGVGLRGNGGGGGGSLLNGSAASNSGGNGGNGQVYILCY